MLLNQNRFAKERNDAVSYLFITVYLINLTIHISSGSEHCITNKCYKVLILQKLSAWLCPNNPQLTEN